MSDENENEQKGKEAPSMPKIHERTSEENPEAKENLDCPAKDVSELSKPFENGHHLPAADVPAAVEKIACSRVDSFMPSSNNVDVADSQQGSDEPNCENVEATAPLDPEDDASAGKDMNILENNVDPVEPTLENVGTSAPPDTRNAAVADGNVEVLDNHKDPLEPVCESAEGSVEPIDKTVENSVEHSHESVEHCVDPVNESVEATISVDRKDEATVDENGGTTELPCEEDEVNDSNLAASHLPSGEPVVLVKVEDDKVNENKSDDAEDNQLAVQGALASHLSSYDDELENKITEPMKIDAPTLENGNSSSEHLFLDEYDEDCLSGTEEQQSSLMKVLEKFFKERNVEFKPPKFYGEGLNCLKLWRSVIRLGGYDKVTSSKLWRQVGESFRPPKTCTTVSWTFRGFYEKALLEFEREKVLAGELNIQAPSTAEPTSVDNQTSGSGRAPRDAAARARQGWHSQRLLGNGEISNPIIKEKSAIAAQKLEKQLKSSGSLKRKKQPLEEDDVTTIQPKSFKKQLGSLDPVCCPQRVDVSVVDIGPPADWVKINVQKSMDCFEVYALVPGLLREEVRVQSDPAGRLVISGHPEQPENPWGVTPFKKVVNLPSRIDPHQTSAVVTLHGQLFVRIPFEQAQQ